MNYLINKAVAQEQLLLKFNYFILYIYVLQLVNREDTKKKKKDICTLPCLSWICLFIGQFFWLYILVVTDMHSQIPSLFITFLKFQFVINVQSVYVSNFKKSMKDSIISEWLWKWTQATKSHFFVISAIFSFKPDWVFSP